MILRFCGVRPTGGKDVKSNLFDNVHWKNSAFEAARSSANRSLAGQYATLESSWWEQRHWGVTVFMETLLAAQSVTPHTHAPPSFLRSPSHHTHTPPSLPLRRTHTPPSLPLRRTRTPPSVPPSSYYGHVALVVVLVAL